MLHVVEKHVSPLFTYPDSGLIGWCKGEGGGEKGRRMEEKGGDREERTCLPHY